MLQCVLQDSEARTTSACRCPMETISVSMDTMRERALQVLSVDDVTARKLPPLVPAVSNALMELAYRVVWKLDKTQLHDWSKQRALAKVIASISGCRVPSWAEAERPGQRMHEFISRYQQRRRKVLEAERKAISRAAPAATVPYKRPKALESRIELEQTLYYCRYGCTPAIVPASRLPPGEQPKKVEHTPSCLLDDNLALIRENAALKRLESEAVQLLESKLHQSSMDLLSAVSTEYATLRAIEKEQKRLREMGEENESTAANLKATKLQKKELERSLQTKEGEILCLGGKVARAHVELSRQIQLNEQREEELRQVKESAVLQVQAADTRKTHLEVQLKEKVKEIDKQCKKHESNHLHLSSHVTRLHLEMACLQRNFQQEQKLLQKEMDLANEKLRKALEDVARFRKLKNEMAKKKRSAESKADTSAKRLDRAQAAEESLRELQQDYEELHESVEAACAGASAAVEPCSLKVFELTSTHGGCFAAFPWKMRLIIYKWLLRRTPPSAIGQNLVDAAHFLGSGMEVRVPDISTIRRMRQEATLLGEAISAFRIAQCERVVSFGFDETTKFGDGLASANFQIQTMDGDVCDEVLRGAFLIPGGCAEQVAYAIESKLFARGRILLEKWRTIYEAKHGAHSWPGPKACRLGYHRLANSLIMSDTCSAARAAKQQIIDRVATEVEKLSCTNTAWNDLSDDEKEKAKRCYVGDCMQHLRNIFLDAMSAEATRVLQDELRESLESFSSYERMSTDPMQLIRAVYKEFHHQGEYAKGKGKDFEHWRKTTHSTSFFLPFERARGGRQDLAFDGAVPLFANRVMACTFLREVVFTPGHSNILEDFLWHTLSCVEMVALMRVLTLWNLILSMPLRWLCGCSSQLSNWSIYDFGPVLDGVEALLEKVAADGEVLLDESLDPFASIAEQQPLFKRWRDHLQTDEIHAPDGQTKFRWYPLLLDEARSPRNHSNRQSTDTTTQLAMAMAIQGLKKMRDPRAAIRDWLCSTEGKYSSSHVTAMERRATVGAHATNDRVESNFGGYDNVIRIFRTISIDAASGMAQQMRVHHLESRVSHVAHDRRKAKVSVPDEDRLVSSSVGFFDSQLTEALQESAIEMARQLRADARVWERSDKNEQAEYRAMKRAQNLQLQLDALAEKGAVCLERFHAYEHRAAQSWQEMRTMMDTMQTASQAAYLREQIELRVLGLGWSDLAITWSKAAETREESITRLCTHVREVLLPAEQERRQQGQVPSEAPLPDFKAKSVKQLGRPTTDSTELASRALCSPEQLQAAIEREHERRAAAGFSDAVQALQPKEAPNLDEDLHGKKLEVCWNYISTEDGKTTVPIWCPCTVVKIADGTTDRGRDGQLLSRRARTLAPRGMVLVEWDADPERGEPEPTQCWYLLDPRKWQGRQTERDKDTHRAWRYHPEELMRMRTQRRQ